MSVSVIGLAQSLWGSIKLGSKACSNVRAVNIDVGCATSVIKSSVCDFQAMYANYLFSLSSKHMKFKTAISEQNDSKEIHDLYQDLKNYSSGELLGIFGWACAEIKKYFSASRSSLYREPPTVCVHLIYEEATVQRVSPLNSDRTNTIRKKISEYTGFEYVHTSGIPYADNYTPDTLKSDRSYKHGSLDCL